MCKCALAAALIDPKEILPEAIEDVGSRHFSAHRPTHEAYKMRFVEQVQFYGSQRTQFADSEKLYSDEVIRIALGGVSPTEGMPSVKAVRKLLETYAQCITAYKRTKYPEQKLLTPRERWLVVNRLERAGMWNAARFLAEKFFSCKDVGRYPAVPHRVAGSIEVHRPAVMLERWEDNQPYDAERFAVPPADARLP